jgi:hypothetical protein
MYSGGNALTKATGTIGLAEGEGFAGTLAASLLPCTGFSTCFVRVWPNTNPDRINKSKTAETREERLLEFVLAI